ncbi:MAG: helix-hairpin-helix domain-containing protein [Bacteroidota bacterium]
MGSFFSFNKQEQRGTLYLAIILVVLQGLVFIADRVPRQDNEVSLMDAALLTELDSMKKAVIQQRKAAIYPFNPNYLSDFKAYTLGISPEEIDRLFAYRKTGKYIQSAAQFQEVTQVSDSLLTELQPYFKFKQANFDQQKTIYTQEFPSKKEVRVKDLNSATAMELKAVYGIGEKLSVRIVKFRDRLGGFLANEQLYDVYGLDSITVEKTLKRFQVIKVPRIEKINVLSASVEELASLVYIRRNVAENIVIYRETQGIESLEDLKAVEGFPTDKITRIGLYLSLKKD